LSTQSLRKRLLVAATLTLIAFLGLAGVALDRAFVSSTRVTVKNQLKSQVNALLTLMNIDENGFLVFPENMPETRLISPNSGLYAFILNHEGDVIWRSGSSVGILTDQIVPISPGVESFYQVDGKLEAPFHYGFGIAWEYDIGRFQQLSLVMVAESDSFVQAISSHRNVLAFWLGTAGLFLLIMQGISLRWGLAPLREVVRELDLVERGEQSTLEGRYPMEIAQLSRRLNQFIESERKNLSRYRNTLGDLAHSLKTPLAVIRGMTEGERELDRKYIAEHVEQMDKIVEYQLKRANTSTLSVFHGNISVDPVTKKIENSLAKVYADKNLHVEGSVSKDAVFVGDEGDLYEVLGNILDNAFKWASSSVRYSVAMSDNPHDSNQLLVIEVEDDGPGIAPDIRSSVTRRGARADQQIPGQGIGLAVVREIADRYDAQLEIEGGDQGGACVRISFPTTER